MSDVLRHVVGSPNYSRMRHAVATPLGPCSALFDTALGPISVEAFEDGVEPLLVFYVCRTDEGRGES